MGIYWVVPTISYQQLLLQWRSRLRFPILEIWESWSWRLRPGWGVVISNWYLTTWRFQLMIWGPVVWILVRDAGRKRDWVSILCWFSWLNTTNLNSWLEADVSKIQPKKHVKLGCFHIWDDLIRTISTSCFLPKALGSWSRAATGYLVECRGISVDTRMDPWRSAPTFSWSIFSWGYGKNVYKWPNIKG